MKSRLLVDYPSAWQVSGAGRAFWVPNLEKYPSPSDANSSHMKLYFIGHYNPHGNHFFAYSVKDAVVKWLDPKPVTYSKPNPDSIDFKGYLVGYH